MVTEIENYPNEKAMKVAKLRTAQRHIDKWRPIQTNKIDNGYEIVWSNDPPTPPKPPRSLTQRAFIEELATERNIRLI